MAFMAFDGYSQPTVQLISINKNWKWLNMDLKTLEAEQTGTEAK